LLPVTIPVGRLLQPGLSGGPAAPHLWIMQLTSDHSRNEGIGLTANIASRRCLPLFSSFSS